MQLCSSLLTHTQGCSLFSLYVSSSLDLSLILCLCPLASLILSISPSLCVTLICFHCHFHPSVFAFISSDHFFFQDGWMSLCYRFQASYLKCSCTVFLFLCLPVFLCLSPNETQSLCHFPSLLDGPGSLNFPPLSYRADSPNSIAEGCVIIPGH